MRQPGTIATLALVLVAASLLLEHSPSALALSAVYHSPWFVTRWRVARRSLPKGYAVKEKSIARTASRRCIAQAFPDRSLVWRPLEQVDLRAALHHFVRWGFAGPGRPDRVKLPPPDHASIPLRCDRQRFVAHGRLVRRTADAGILESRVELESTAIDALVSVNRYQADENLYLTRREGPRFCVVSVAQSDSPDADSSAQEFEGRKQISVIQLIRTAPWNRWRDDFEGEFALRLDCYRSGQRVEATSRYSLNCDYDTRAGASAACRKSRRGGQPADVETSHCDPNDPLCAY